MMPIGPSNAKVMIIGEAPGEYEIMKGMPFIGPSGMELDKMLNEAGIHRSQCFITNVCQERPPGNDMGEWLVNLKNPPKPDNAKYKNKKWVSWKGQWAHPAVVAGYEGLIRHIELVRPTLIIALGNTALFALTGEWGIKSWRGSQLVGTVGNHTCKVIPAYHPAAVLRDWSIRAVTVHDFRRCAREMHTPLPYIIPNYERIIRPSFAQVVNWLAQLRMKLAHGMVLNSADIETRGGHIACIGMYVKGLPTICIPWMVDKKEESKGDAFSYWSASEELYIWKELRAIFKHKNTRVIGQNWHYDSQYLYRFLFIKIRVFWDTMVTQHCMYPGMPKGLDYLSSLYCQFHRYWKDDIKDWDPKMGELQFWAYNCEDCERTYEIYEAQRPIIEGDPGFLGSGTFKLIPSIHCFSKQCYGVSGLTPQISHASLRSWMERSRFERNGYRTSSDTK
jgi:uracil-DNA glycosylase